MVGNLWPEQRPIIWHRRGCQVCWGKLYAQGWWTVEYTQHYRSRSKSGCCPKWSENGGHAQWIVHGRATFVTASSRNYQISQSCNQAAVVTQLMSELSYQTRSLCLQSMVINKNAQPAPTVIPAEHFGSLVVGWTPCFRRLSDWVQIAKSVRFWWDNGHSSRMRICLLCAINGLVIHFLR